MAPAHYEVSVDDRLETARAAFTDFCHVFDTHYPSRPEDDEVPDSPMISIFDAGKRALTQHVIETAVRGICTDQAIDAIKVALREHHADLLGNNEEAKGYYVRIEGSLPPSAPGGKYGVINVVIVPPGHTPPSHLHQDGGDGIGEITSSAFGQLDYIGPGGRILSLVEGESARVSPPDLDVYQLQPDGQWYVGIYVQRKPATVFPETNGAVLARRALAAQHFY